MAAAGPAPQEPAQDEYGHLHKIVLQGMIQAGFLNLKGVKDLFSQACDFLKYNEEQKTEALKMDNVQRVVRLINEKMKPFNMAIKSACCELTESKYFLFMLTIESNVLRMQQYFTKTEIDIFQRCMDGMLRKYSNFALPVSECINILKEIDTKTSLSQAEEFINKMIRMQYFAQLRYPEDNPEYDVTLGIRGLREFEPLLYDLYRDVVIQCSFCKMILLQGLSCPGTSSVPCGICFHRICFRKYVRESKCCKSCKKPWLSEKDVQRRVRSVEPNDGQEHDDDDLTETQSDEGEPEPFMPPPTPGNFYRRESESVGADAGMRKSRRAR